jgi:hypothetical protein
MKNQKNNNDAPKNVTIANAVDYLPTIEQMIEFIESKSRTKWAIYAPIFYLFTLAIMIVITLFDSRIPVAAPLYFNFGVEPNSFYRLIGALGDSKGVLFLSLFVESFFCSTAFAIAFSIASCALFTRYNFNIKFYYLLIAAWVADQLKNIILMFLIMEVKQYSTPLWFVGVLNSIKLSFTGVWLLAIILSLLFGSRAPKTKTT